MREKVDDVFKDVFGVDPRQGAVPFVYNETAGWDSVGHMTLVAGLEQKFGCMLEMDEILDMSSYDKVVEIMAKYA